MFLPNILTSICIVFLMTALLSRVRHNLKAILICSSLLDKDAEHSFRWCLVLLIATLTVTHLLFSSFHWRKVALTPSIFPLLPISLFWVSVISFSSLFSCDSPRLSLFYCSRHKWRPHLKRNNYWFCFFFQDILHTSWTFWKHRLTLPFSDFLDAPPSSELGGSPSPFSSAPSSQDLWAPALANSYVFKPFSPFGLCHSSVLLFVILVLPTRQGVPSVICKTALGSEGPASLPPRVTLLDAWGLCSCSMFGFPGSQLDVEMRKRRDTELCCVGRSASL